MSSSRSCLNYMWSHKYVGVREFVNKSAASTASPDYVKFQAVIKSAASAASLRGGRATGRLDHDLFFAIFGRASGQKKKSKSRTLFSNMGGPCRCCLHVPCRALPPAPLYAGHIQPTQVLAAHCTGECKWNQKGQKKTFFVYLLHIF